MPGDHFTEIEIDPDQGVAIAVTVDTDTGEIASSQVVSLPEEARHGYQGPEDSDGFRRYR